MFEEIREYAEEIRYEKIPEDVIKRTKIQILNELCALKYGENFVDRIIKRKEELPLGDISSLFIMTTSSMVLDWDDYLFAGHTGHSSVFTAIYTAQKTKINGRNFLESIVLGNEVGGRIGISAVFGVLNGQMMNFIHGAISSSVYLKLLRMERYIPQAMAIFFSNPTHPNFFGFMGGETKFLTASIPTVLGVLSAHLAICGLKSKNTFGGFLNDFSFQPFYHPFHDYLSKTLCFKFNPGCAYVLPVVDAMEKIREKIGDSDPDEIEIRANHITYNLEKVSMKFFSDDNIVPFYFSSFIAGSATLIGLKMYEVEKIKLNFGKILSLCRKVKIYPDLSLTYSMITRIMKNFPYLKKVSPKSIVLAISNLISRKIVNFKFFGKIGKIEIENDFPLYFPVEVRVRIKDKVFKEKVGYHRGSGKYSLDEIENDISEKARIVFGEEGEEIKRLIWEIEKYDDVGKEFRKFSFRSFF